MAKSPTLNRFPLFGLFAHRAARKMGYTDEEARLLGYSTALLYAIFKAKAQKKDRGEKAKKEPSKEVHAEDRDHRVRRAAVRGRQRQAEKAGEDRRRARGP